MRKVRVLVPSFDLHNDTSVANVLCSLEANDNQIEMAINELVDYVYILESKVHELQYQLDVVQDTFNKGKKDLIIIEELSKDVN